jgi:hypothetical protein
MMMRTGWYLNRIITSCYFKLKGSESVGWEGGKCEVLVSCRSDGCSFIYNLIAILKKPISVSARKYRQRAANGWQHQLEYVSYYQMTGMTRTTRKRK